MDAGVVSGSTTGAALMDSRVGKYTEQRLCLDGSYRPAGIFLANHG